MKICENCGFQHEGVFSSGRFCSLKCSRSFSTKARRKEINEKVSRKLIKNEGHDVQCKCGKTFRAYKDSSKFCSKSCSMTYRDFEIRSKSASKIQKKLVEEGRHNGFPSRKEKEPSWAEKFVIDKLNSNGIDFKRDFKINRFFADFAFLEKKLVLEIDGKQHLERKEKDALRDEILERNGWRTVRIQWVHRNFELMNEKLDEFLANEF